MPVPGAAGGCLGVLVKPKDAFTPEVFSLRGLYDLPVLAEVQVTEAESVGHVPPATGVCGNE